MDDRCWHKGSLCKPIHSDGKGLIQPTLLLYRHPATKSGTSFMIILSYDDQKVNKYHENDRPVSEFFTNWVRENN
jgi:hypothetical protein